MKESSKKLRVGVIGAGYLGKFHAEKYAKMDEVEIVGIVDINQSRALAVAEKVCSKAYSSHSDLIGKIDAVSIVVDTPAHFSVSKDFLENNVHVLIEKPMTTSLKQADNLIELAKNRGCIIQVGHLERFNPAIFQLHDIINQPRFIEVHRLGIYKARCTDVSVVLDLMIHDIDIILSFVKSDIRSISAAGSQVISDQIDIANARLEFENGCVANLTASRISTKNQRKIRLFQKDAYISVDFTKHSIVLIQKKDGVTNSPVPGTDVQHLSFTQGDALEEEIKSFVNAVIQKKTPKVTGQMGRAALEVALNIVDRINASSI